MKKGIYLVLASAIAILSGGAAYANKASVEIVASDSVKAGTDITITLNVSHKGNTDKHFTKWVWVKADGKEIARWDFTATKLPENEKFTREVHIKVSGYTIIESEAYCNLHGSAGIVKKQIAVHK
jgi:desulfoferrodoxin (superoxide reductase-like protein)